MKTNIIKFWMNLTHSNSQKEINLYTPTFLETYRGFELGFIYVCSKVHYTWQMRLQDMSDKIMTSDGLKHSILKSVFYKSNVEDSFASKIEPHISYKQLRWYVLQNLCVYLKYEARLCEIVKADGFSKLLLLKKRTLAIPLLHYDNRGIWIICSCCLVALIFLHVKGTKCTTGYVREDFINPFHFSAILIGQCDD